MVYIGCPIYIGGNKTRMFMRVMHTQMVWANTAEVGCGVRRCAEIEGDWNDDDDDEDDENDEDNNENILFLVCNYGPG